MPALQETISGKWLKNLASSQRRRATNSRQSIALPRRWRPQSSAPHTLSGSAARSHSEPPFWKQKSSLIDNLKTKSTVHVRQSHDSLNEMNAIPISLVTPRQ